MAGWSALQVLLIIIGHLTCADITTEPIVTEDGYYNYDTITAHENKSSYFDLSIYNNTCDDSEMNATREFCESPEGDVMETCERFQKVVRSMMDFSCYLSEDIAEAAINVSTDYINDCQDNQTCADGIEIINALQAGLRMCNTTEALYMNLLYSIQRIMILQKQIGPLNESYVWERIVEQQTYLVEDFKKYINNVEDLLNFLNEQNITNIFLSGVFISRTNLQYLNTILDKQSDYLVYCQDMKTSWNKIDVVRFDIRLAMFSFLFIVGATGNIILILVFIKYRDMRTTANIMLINLSVVDC
ncbi:hypothetical protein L9F63_005980, partial [Diploptera punctata]